jgi:hypothetical protein
MIKEVLTIVRSLQRAATEIPKEDRQDEIELRFVAISSRCFWTIGKQSDQPLMQIVTHWHVTNVLESGMPARILEAFLLEPRGKLSKLTLTPVTHHPRTPIGRNFHKDRQANLPFHSTSNRLRSRQANR